MIVWFTLKDNPYWFFPLEGVFIVSLLVGAKLSRAILEPQQFLHASLDQLREGEFATRYQPSGNPDLNALVETYNRMVDSLREERLKLGEQRDFLDKLLHASPAAVFVFDFDGRISHVNPSASDLLRQQPDAVIGRSLDQLGLGWTNELSQLGLDVPKIIHAQGSRRLRCVRSQFKDRGFTRAFIMVEELTEELRERDRMAYEKLLRMMAHEINNTVGATNSLLESCLTFGESLQGNDQDDFRTSIETIITRHEHLNRVMREFAAVLKVPEPRCQETDIHQLVKDVHRLVSAACERTGIEWRWHCPDSLPVLSMDQHLMEQVLMNIVKNAMEAIGERGAIDVHLMTQSGSVTLVIEDSAGALTAEVKNQLFSPFFSTKASGRGIGLTLIQEILVQHGFEYSLEGEPGRSTRFTIHFPIPT